MARVLNPLMSERAKGTIGGVTFASWKGMPVARRMPIPSRRRRTTQPMNRSLLGFLSREYTTLTSGQRELWETYSLNHPHDDGFGGTFILSGQNTYIMLNHPAVRLFGVGMLQVTPPVDPPSTSARDFTAITGVGNPGEIDLAWFTYGAATNGDKFEIRQAGPFQSPARQEVHSRFKFIESTNFDVLIATIDGLVEGTWYWFLLRYIDRFGQTTAWLTDQATPKVTP